MNEHEIDERIERAELLIGRELDGRLNESEAGELERLRAGFAPARDLTASMRNLRAALRNEPDPAIPEGLFDRIVERVAQVRADVRVESAVLSLGRRLAVAAAVLLLAGLFALAGGFSGFAGPRVEAGPSGAREEPTVEDELRAHPAPDGSFVNYLRWRFLRRES